MLLLDEPTNHLDAESVEWLEQYLARFPCTVVAVTHDRYFLDNAAEWILELDRGTGIPYKGNYSEWLEQKRQRLQQEESSETARQKSIKKELEWVRRTAKGQQTKNIARLKRFEELNSYEYQKRNETAEIFIPVAERLGNEVIEFKNVSKGYGKRLLIDNLSFSVPPGAIVGIIGPNGAGKSTLFRMITGKEKPDKGEVKVGHTVQLSWVGQRAAAYRLRVKRDGGKAEVLIDSTTKTSVAFDAVRGHRYTFVVSALDATGGEAAESAPFVVDVPPSASSVMLAATPTSGRHPLSVRLTAVLRPNERGVTPGSRSVILEVVLNGSWRQASSTLTSASGRATWTFKLAPGLYRLRALFPATDDLAASTSPAVVIRVT